MTKFAYLTFGKSSRLGELFVGTLILGGASKVGTVPDGISGLKGIGVCGLCLCVVCWLGIRTGQSTISPTLNTYWKATIISILQFLFIAVAVGIVAVLRTSVIVAITQISEATIREVALVCLLTLGYVLTVNRTSKLTDRQRSAKNRLTQLHKDMRNLRETEDATPDPDKIISDMKNTGEKIPRSQFDDVNELKSELESVVNSLERLDHDSKVEIITGNKSTSTSNNYDKALSIYNSVYNTIGKVQTDARIY